MKRAKKTDHYSHELIFSIKRIVKGDRKNQKQRKKKYPIVFCAISAMLMIGLFFYFFAEPSMIVIVVSEIVGGVAGGVIGSIISEIAS